jgi:hypothetical protein
LGLIIKARRHHWQGKSVFLKERQFKMVSVYVTAFIISIVFAAMSFAGLETNP